MISWEEVKRKAKARPGQFVDWDDHPCNKPKKKIEQCFIINDVVWTITVTNKLTGKIDEPETNSGILEREFKSKYKHLYTWE